MTKKATLIILGFILLSPLSVFAQMDLMTNPIYSYMPGNMYNSQTPGSYAYEMHKIDERRRQQAEKENSVIEARSRQEETRRQSDNLQTEQPHKETIAEVKVSAETYKRLSDLRRAAFCESRKRDIEAYSEDKLRRYYQILKIRWDTVLNALTIAPQGGFFSDASPYTPELWKEMALASYDQSPKAKLALEKIIGEFEDVTSSKMQFAIATILNQKLVVTTNRIHYFFEVIKQVKFFEAYEDFQGLKKQEKATFEYTWRCVDKKYLNTSNFRSVMDDVNDSNLQIWQFYCGSRSESFIYPSADLYY